MSLSVNIKKKLENFSLEIRLEAGDTVLGILGASGSGKSMTLRSIAGIETPDSGEIVLNGRVLYSSERGINLPPRERNVGLMFQSYALFPTMTVAENIASGVRVRGDKKVQVDRYLELLRLESLAGRYPRQLSGGQQQRVALARMMASEPGLLMLDEPFSALDNDLRHTIEPEFRAALGAYRGTVAYVSHSIGEIYRYCAYTAVVCDGHVVEEGETAELFARPRRVETARILCCKNLTAAEAVGDGFAEVPAWGMRLRLPEHAGAFRQVGIFGDDLQLCAQEEDNRFPAEVLELREHPRHVMALVRLPGAAEPLRAACGKVAVKQLRTAMEQGTVTVRLPPEKLLLLED